MKKREIIGPDLTPLVDVVFILLIFFIVTSVFKKENLALQLNLPTSKAQELEVKQKDISIELSSNHLAILGKRVSMDDFDKYLHDVTNKKINIIVRIDENVPYKRIVKVLDSLQRYQLYNLSLVTKKE